MIRHTRLLLLLAALVLVPWGCGDFDLDRLAAPDAEVRLTDGPGIEVMSQNLYLGVDLGTLFAGDLATALGQLQATTALDAAAPSAGPRRLRAIAERIVAEQPHFVGLQEVTTFELTFADGSQAVLDFQAVLQGWLDYLYYVAGVSAHRYHWVVNPLIDAPPIDLPVLGGIRVRYLDADAILVRDDVWPTVSDVVVEPYDAVATFDVFGSELVSTRGWEAVTAEVEGREVVFVNTHLEVQAFGDVQVAQAGELIAFMKSQDLPVIAVGDFNSAANHDAPADQYSGSYQLFRDAGYTDLWLRQSHSVGGLTCCQAGDLTNPETLLHSRLDLVLVDWNPAGFAGQSRMDVVGEEPDDRVVFTAVTLCGDGPFPLTLWPADHAGVVATLWPAPGRME